VLDWCKDNDICPKDFHIYWKKYMNDDTGLYLCCKQDDEIWWNNVCGFDIKRSPNI